MKSRWYGSLREDLRKQKTVPGDGRVGGQEREGMSSSGFNDHLGLVLLFRGKVGDAETCLGEEGEGEEGEGEGPYRKKRKRRTV